MLARVPGSVLWLLRFPPEAEALLCAEASRRINGQSLAARIIFSDVAPKPLHLARLARLADVYLDTPTCNAHTGVSGLMAARTGGAAATHTQVCPV